jgi:sugar phosphate isomerase/epimerase
MHERISINSISFLGSPLAEFAGICRELKPKRVSLLNAELDNPAAVRAMLDDGGYKLETITHIFLPGRTLDTGEENWATARAGLDKVIDGASALGAASIYMLTGGRGALTWEQAAENFSAMIKPCVARAKAANVQLLIENASNLYADLHIAHNLRDLTTLAEMADIGINIDMYGVWTEAGLKGAIERAMPRCHLVQASDYVYGDRSLPCRAVIGDGAMPWPRILDWLLSAGFKGGFDLELIGPRIEQEGRIAANRRCADRLGEMLHKLGA